MAYYHIAILLAASGLFLFGLSCVIYVAYRFLSLVLSLDAAMLREFKLNVRSPNPVLGRKIEYPTQPNTEPTEGSFEPTSDENMYVQEQVEQLRGIQGLSDADLASAIRQAVGDQA